MFACVHVACKVEEVHEITLDRLLDAAGCGNDEPLKTKVAGLELPLLESIGFVLLIEPKPLPSLRMLMEELRQLLDQGTIICRALPISAAENTWEEVVAHAEEMALDTCARTDACLRWAPSLVIAASLGAALDSQFGTSAPAGDVGNRSESQAVSEVLGALLDTHLEDEQHRLNTRRMLEEARGQVQRLENLVEVTEDGVREIVKTARRCHRAFERLRDEASERHEANRKERKRRWSEMKGNGRRQVPTPILQGLSEFNQKMASLQADGVEDFVIHRPKEDLEEEWQNRGSG